MWTQRHGSESAARVDEGLQRLRAECSPAEGFQRKASARRRQAADHTRAVLTTFFSDYTFAPLSQGLRVLAQCVSVPRRRRGGPGTRNVGLAHSAPSTTRTFR